MSKLKYSQMLNKKKKLEITSNYLRTIKIIFFFFLQSDDYIYWLNHIEKIIYIYFKQKLLFITKIIF